ncbi:hypothetical protein EOB59_05430 [Mesorhizobium sp. M7A.F.Ca.MR.176.00.0.0]|uniref:hypothetical protein n=1 Tax=Mesorhizobium sp. M7A.F.Ca.MR.176.00.0.0 TaxID=2496776 RepID=UPI000FD22DAF|nr:hypothetical protein [Mesorhizobium sp. M7A.F.Ca.MR.176.00.0.0]RUU92800.1 hypothetical protein EOB59_05430 [Mesorhizobium sp. M7A.F.Ca.MR.176.00.0.0]
MDSAPKNNHRVVLSPGTGMYLGFPLALVMNNALDCGQGGACYVSDQFRGECHNPASTSLAVRCENRIAASRAPRDAKAEELDVLIEFDIDVRDCAARTIGCRSYRKNFQG